MLVKIKYKMATKIQNGFLIEIEFLKVMYLEGFLLADDIFNIQVLWAIFNAPICRRNNFWAHFYILLGTETLMEPLTSVVLLQGKLMPWPIQSDQAKVPMETFLARKATVGLHFIKV